MSVDDNDTRVRRVGADRWKVGDKVTLTDLPRGKVHEGEVTYVEPGVIHVTAGSKTWSVRHPYNFVSRRGDRV